MLAGRVLIIQYWRVVTAASASADGLSVFAKLGTMQDYITLTGHNVAV